MDEKRHERMAAVYRKIRDRRADLKAEFKKEDDALKDQMEAIENAFMEEMDALGQTTVKTNEGTVFIKESMKANFADWDAALAWMKEHDDFGLLTQRPAINAVREHINEEGEPPPGVNIFRERSVQIRKPSKK